MDICPVRKLSIVREDLPTLQRVELEQNHELNILVLLCRIGDKPDYDL